MCNIYMLVYNTSMNTIILCKHACVHQYEYNHYMCNMLLYTPVWIIRYGQWNAGYKKQKIEFCAEQANVHQYEYHHCVCNKHQRGHSMTSQNNPWRDECANVDGDSTAMNYSYLDSNVLNGPTFSNGVGRRQCSQVGTDSIRSMI